jgi:hypothetical protein
MSDTDFAKSHLRDHLATLIVPAVSDGFWSVYKTSKELCERNGQLDQILRTFQNLLTKIPEWSDTTLATEVERIEKASKCSFLDDLLMGVFISYMKSFASIHYRGSSSHVDIDFDRPTMEKFIHALYISSARKIWQVAYLFKTVGTTSEQQARNRQEIEKIINECLEQVIRSFLPWQSIAKQFSATSTEVASTVPDPQAEEPKRRVVFDEESEDEDEDEENERPPLTVSQDDASIDFESLDIEEEPKAKEEEEVDPMKEIEGNAKSEFVLNL